MCWNGTNRAVGSLFLGGGGGAQDVSAQKISADFSVFFLFFFDFGEKSWNTKKRLFLLFFYRLT